MSPERLNCMEVFGGSEPASRGVALGGLDAWVESRPYEQADAGGDVYYVSSCATGRITRLLLADVSGHGSAVAEVAKVLRGLMREHVNHLDQRRFVARMNDAFLAHSTNGMFATALICTYFAPTRSLSIVNAGHPPPLVYRASERRWSVLDCDPDRADSGACRNVPLGVIEVEAFEQFRITLRDGDRIFCHTDSLIEACDCTTGEPLGTAGVVELLNTLAHDHGIVDGERVAAALLDALRCRVNNALDDDDTTTLTFAPNPTSEHVTFATRMLAPLRLIGGAFRWRTLALPEFTVANLGGSMIPFLSKWKSRA